MDHLITRAINAYLRWCNMRGVVGQMPSSASAVEDGVVVLRNVNGELARYRVGTNGHLRRLTATTSDEASEEAPEVEEKLTRVVMLQVLGNEMISRVRTIILEVPEDAKDSEIEDLSDGEIDKLFDGAGPNAQWEEAYSTGIRTVGTHVVSDDEIDTFTPDRSLVRNNYGRLVPDTE